MDSVHIESKVADGVKRPLTKLEWLVLEGIKEYGRVPTGDGLIKYVSCARRLEKRGLCVKWVAWHLTKAGEEALRNHVAAADAGGRAP